MKRISIFFIVSIALFCVGCSATYYRPQAKNIITEFVVNKDYNTTWSNVIEWFGTMNINVKTMNKESGYLQTEGYIDTKYLKNYCDCGYVEGGMNSYFFEDLFYRFNVTIAKLESKKTRVRINLNYFANLNQYSYNLNTRKWVLIYQTDADCKSNGSLEASLKNNLDTK